MDSEERRSQRLRAPSGSDKLTGWLPPCLVHMATASGYITNVGQQHSAGSDASPVNEDRMWWWYHPDRVFNKNNLIQQGHNKICLLTGDTWACGLLLSGMYKEQGLQAVA